MAREVDSRIDHVTVYASGARVRRIATLHGELAPIRIAGLPLAVIDDSVRVAVDGPATAVALRTGVDVAAGDPADEEPGELRAARRRVLLAEAEAARLESAVERVTSAALVEEDPSDEPPAAWAAVVTARRALVGAIAERHGALRDRLAAARRDLAEARRALEVAADRVRQASSARGPRRHEVRKYVEIELVGQGAGGVAIRLEYDVAAARWAPSYVARLEGDQVRVELRAVVAQGSGEDWTGVALALSTAEPHRFAELPELAPQKIGRRQHEPARRGFRAPPSGAEQLYADFDRGFPRRRARPITGAGELADSMFEGRMPEPQAAYAELAKESWDEESSRAKVGYGAEMTVPATLAHGRARKGDVSGATAAPMAMAMAMRRPLAPGAPAKTMPLEPAPVEPTPRLDYGNLRITGPRAPDRGRLVPAPRDAVDDAVLAGRVGEAALAIAELALPPGCAAEWTHAYDYAFASDAAVDVRSDASWHSIAVASRGGTAKLRHVAVPREQADVFRLAEIGNPFEGPLLPGPIDVYDRGQFLVTSELDYTPPGATVEIGLGVDAAIKIARNVEFHEEAAGMLRGALRLVHAIAIEIENASQRAVDLEVRERVPVTREGDADIEVVVGKIDPAWERWTPDPDAPSHVRLRGAHRWRVALPPGGKKLLRAAYEVKIAGKQELVGGNRREP